MHTKLLKFNEYLKYSDFISDILTEEEQTVDKNTQIARIKVSYAFQVLTGKYRFFAELAYKLKLVFTRHLPYKTAATDGIHLFMDPDFFASLTEKQILFILCHEVMHCALLHTSRIGGRDHETWNRAGDYEINILLADDNIISADEVKSELNGLIDEKYRNMNAEQIYETLPISQTSQNNQGKNGESNQSSSSNETSTLQVGDIIRNDVTGGYGVVTKIDISSNEIEYDPITKEEAAKKIG